MTYNADVFVSSGDGSGICDFKIIDCKSVTSEEPDFSAGLWTPIDGEKKATIVFKEAVLVSEVKLYQNSDKKQRISKGILRFSDGSKILVKMKKKPCCTLSFEPKSEVRWISFEILSAKNDKFGISEIEAFEKPTPILSKTKDRKKYKKINCKQWLYVYNKEYRYRV